MRDVEVMWRKTMNHASSMVYTLINHGFFGGVYVLNQKNRDATQRKEVGSTFSLSSPVPIGIFNQHCDPFSPKMLKVCFRVCSVEEWGECCLLPIMLVSDVQSKFGESIM